MSTPAPVPGSTPAEPPEPDSGSWWVRVLRWAAAAVLLVPGFYLSGFFAGWTLHPEADPAPIDIVSGLGFAALLAVAAVALGRALLGRRPWSVWLLTGFFFPVVAVADAYLW